MNNKNKNKRQVYIWDENMVLFNTTKNKSQLINLLLRKYRQKVEEDGESTAEQRTARKNTRNS